MNLLKSLGLLMSLLALLLLVVWPLNLPAKMGWLGHYSPRSVSTISEKKEEMVSNNLLKLARAMIEFEGWHYPNPESNTYFDGSPSWRNHNPGNLRSSPFQVGIRNGFAVFVNDEVGFFALVWDLRQKATGNTSTGLNGQSTIYQLIKKYSGESEGIVLKYATFIEKRTDLKMTTKLEELLK